MQAFGPSAHEACAIEHFHDRTAQVARWLCATIWLVAIIGVVLFWPFLEVNL
jgi:hypothetical protein